MLELLGGGGILQESFYIICDFDIVEVFLIAERSWVRIYVKKYWNSLFIIKYQLNQ